MRKFWLLSLLGASIMLAAASAAWVVLAGFYFLLTGGTYGYTTPDGTIVCGIPVFTAEGWLRPALVIFGVPLAAFAAGVGATRYCRRRLPFVGLR